MTRIQILELKSYFEIITDEEKEEYYELLKTCETPKID